MDHQDSPEDGDNILRRQETLTPGLSLLSSHVQTVHLSGRTVESLLRKPSCRVVWIEFLLLFIDEYTGSGGQAMLLYNI